MTIVIGIKGEGYAILASDCLVTTGQLSNKVRYAGDASFPLHNGIYVAQAGAVDASGYWTRSFFEQIGKDSALVDLLDDSIITNTSFSALNFEREKLKNRTYSASAGKKNELYGCIDEIDQLFKIRSIVEHTKADHWSNVALRYSAKKGIDLLSISKARVNSVSYVTDGLGEELVGTEIADAYTSYLCLDEALSVVIKAMNKALAIETTYQGYSLVIVQKQETGFQVQTAANLEAHSIDRETLSLSETIILPYPHIYEFIRK